MLAGEASRDLSLDFGVFALAFVFNPKNPAYQPQLSNAIDLATDDEVVVIQERANASPSTIDNILCQHELSRDLLELLLPPPFRVGGRSLAVLSHIACVSSLISLRGLSHS
jgi:hypothetical protein